MKSEQRQDLHANTLAVRLGGAPEFIRQHAAKGITLIAVAILAFSIMRYRMISQEQSYRQAVDATFSLRRSVQNLADLDGAMGWSDAQRAASRTAIVTEANESYEKILSQAAESDAALRAQAHLQHGNVNWTLANMAELPGAATQPGLKLKQSKADLLATAARDYQFVIDTYPNETVAKASAMFGLAAVAENEGNFDLAVKRYQQIAADASIDPTLREAATQQARLAGVRKNRLFVGSYPVSTTGPNVLPIESPAETTETTVPKFLKPLPAEPTTQLGAHAAAKPTVQPSAPPQPSPTTRRAASGH